MTEKVPVPRGGVDYPATWQAFESWFATEDACRAFLTKLRWPDGFVCPMCHGREGWQTARGLWMCRVCGRQTSVTAGTIFHRSRLPLRTWFSAMWFVCAQKSGVSALGLQRVLGFGSYETAWAWLHKLRRATVRPDRELLGGEGVTVELDQTFIGGRAPSKDVRYINKSEVVIAVELRHPTGFGRVRLGVIDIADRGSQLSEFARAAIAPGTVLRTDGDRLYKQLAQSVGATHERSVQFGAKELPHDMLPGVHRVASLLKRWARRNTPQWALGGTPRVLPRRVHVSVQSSWEPQPRPALLPPSPAGGEHRPPPAREPNLLVRYSP